MKIFIAIISILIFSYQLSAQQMIQGKVEDVSGAPLELVAVFIEGHPYNTVTDSAGQYRLEVTHFGALTLGFSRLGFESKTQDIFLREGESLTVNITLEEGESRLQEVTVTGDRGEKGIDIKENPEKLKLLPSVTGNIESVLPHLALGARSGTGGELSSQYNVRGGNYDENLVYVNGFEIFRPQLIRSGQQEGLTFPNMNLIRDITFSSGGYKTEYGDKMSSVLDITYKRPSTFQGSATISLLEASLHLEGSQKIGNSDYQQLRYLVGTRYRTNRYLLGSLDTEGEYTPNFSDFQTFLTYDFTPEWQVGLIANYNTSVYDFIPRSRATAFGSFPSSLQLSSVFQGAEADQFRTGMVGAHLTFLPDRERNPYFVKLLASTYRGREEENIDIVSAYRLSEIDITPGSETQGEEIAVLGTGVQHEYSRNRLFNRITNIQLRGGIELQSQQNEGMTHFFQMGLKYQSEYFDDRLNEWERIDSAGYSLPFDSESVQLFNVLKAENLMESHKITGFLQDTYTWREEDRFELSFTAGMRLSYWSWNEELLSSPRMEFLYKPLSGKRNMTFKLASGIYYQMPFYREVRRLDGTLNPDIRAQRSWHLIGGMSTDFGWSRLSDKPFRLIAEAYYKNLTDLISYDVDNVRIRYSGENDAQGEAMGIDLRVNGEFVRGVESWINVSWLRTMERLDGVRHQRFEDGQRVIVNEVPRPSDQTAHVSLFFQDYLPNNENLGVFLALQVGTGLPFGRPEDNIVNRNPFRFSTYRRVDIGFSYHLWDSLWRDRKPGHSLSGLRNAWINLEVFNLLGVQNVTSNTWVRTVFQQQYAVPDYLTNRRINLKLRVEF